MIWQKIRMERKESIAIKVFKKEYSYLSYYNNSIISWDTKKRETNTNQTNDLALSSNVLSFRLDTL